MNDSNKCLLEINSFQVMSLFFLYIFNLKIHTFTRNVDFPLHTHEMYTSHITTHYTVINYLIIHAKYAKLFRAELQHAILNRNIAKMYTVPNKLWIYTQSTLHVQQLSLKKHQAYHMDYSKSGRRSSCPVAQHSITLQSK